jgi:hypothetical protein
MEARLGQDFSRVRVHTDGKAAAAAGAAGASAYTVGRDIVFGAGQYRPGSAEGQRLLAHELTHVAQQQGAVATGSPVATEAEHPLERQAAEVAAGGRLTAPISAGRQRVSRQAVARQPGAHDVHAGLGDVQGLPMAELLPALAMLPAEVRSDERAGQAAGGPRLVLAMRVVAAGGSAWEPFQAQHTGELGALPADQVREIGAYLRARDVGVLRTTIAAIAPKDIGLTWRSRKQDFEAAANDPTNTLDAAQLYQIWLHHWTDEQAAAYAAFEPLKSAEGKADSVGYADKLQMFQAGRRGVFSPEYEAAADRVTAANYYTSDLADVLGWLEAQLDITNKHATPETRKHVTLEQVRLQTVELIKRRENQMAVLGLALGVAGALEARAMTPRPGAGQAPAARETPGEHQTPGKKAPQAESKAPGSSEPVPAPRLRDTDTKDYALPRPDETPAMYAQRTRRDWDAQTEIMQRAIVREAPEDMEAARLHHALRNPDGLFTHYLTEGGFEQIMLGQELRSGAGQLLHGHGKGIRAVGGPFAPGRPRVAKAIHLDFTVPDPPVPGNVERFGQMGTGVMWHLPEGERLPIEIQRVGYPNGAFAERGGSRGWVLKIPDAAPREVTLQELVRLGESPR